MNGNVRQSNHQRCFSENSEKDRTMVFRNMVWYDWPMVCMTGEQALMMPGGSDLFCNYITNALDPGSTDMLAFQLNFPVMGGGRLTFVRDFLLSNK